jgi:hypothetical protein
MLVVYARMTFSSLSLLLIVVYIVVYARTDVLEPESPAERSSTV